jgi:hypothetical protein
VGLFSSLNFVAVRKAVYSMLRTRVFSRIYVSLDSRDHETLVIRDIVTSSIVAVFNDFQNEAISKTDELNLLNINSGLNDVGRHMVSELSSKFGGTASGSAIRQAVKELGRTEGYIAYSAEKSGYLDHILGARQILDRSMDHLT